MMFTRLVPGSAILSTVNARCCEQMKKDKSGGERAEKIAAKARGEGRKCRERGEGRDEIVKVPLHFHAQGGVEKKLSCTISSSFISLSVLSR